VKTKFKVLVGAMLLAGLLLMAIGNTQSLDTRAHWRNGNLSYRDHGYSAAEGVSLWETCPQLAMLDPYIGFQFYAEFADGDTCFGNAWSHYMYGGDGSRALVDTTGGWLRIITDGDDDDFHDFRTTQEMFKLASGKPLWYEARIATTDATQNDWCIGLMNASTTSPSSFTATDGIYFKKDDGDANIDAAMSKNSTTTLSTGDTLADQADSTMVRLGMVYDGASSVMFYVDGVLKKTYTANLPSDEFLKPVFKIQTGTGAADTLYIDYVKVIQIR